MNKKVKFEKVAFTNAKGTRVWVSWQEKVGEKYMQLWIPADQKSAEELRAMCDAGAEGFVRTGLAAHSAIDEKWSASAYCFELSPLA
jgi:hypothetical protein